MALCLRGRGALSVSASLPWLCVDLIEGVGEDLLEPVHRVAGNKES